MSKANEMRFDPWTNSMVKVKQQQPARKPARKAMNSHIPKKGETNPWTGEVDSEASEKLISGMAKATTAVAAVTGVGIRAFMSLKPGEEAELDYSWTYGSDGSKYWCNPEGHFTSGPGGGVI